MLISTFFVGLYSPSFTPIVHAQTQSSIREVQGPITPSQITSNLTGYPIEFNGTYQVYLKTNSLTPDAINFFNNNYNFTTNIATSQVNGYNSTTAMLDVVSLSGTAMNPLATTASISGNTITYTNAYPLSTNLTYTAGISELDEVLSIGSKPSFSAPADYLQFEENCYYNSSLAIYANGVEYLNPSNAQFTTNGSINFNQVSGNITEFSLPTPIIYDSTRNQTTGNYGVLANNGILVIYIRVPVSFLNNAIYPCFFDPPTLVQGNMQFWCGAGYSTGNGGSFNLTSTPSNGDVIIITAVTIGYNVNAVVTSITEPGVTWSGSGTGQQINSTSTDGSFHLLSSIWLGVVGSSPSKNITVAVTYTTGDACIFDACEWSGVATSSFLDKNATATGDNATALTGTTGTTSQANELLIGAILDYSYGQSTPTNGFTLLDGVLENIGYSQSNAYLYKVVSSTGTYSTGTTVTSSYWAGCIATFKASGSSTYSMTVSSSPATGSGYVTVNGTAETTPYTISSITSGTVYTIAANSPANTVAGQSQYIYSSWNDSGAQSHSVTVTSSNTYTASFTLQYYVAITTSRVGSDTSGTVATLQGTGEPQSSLPYSVWVNSGGSCTYAFSSPLTGTNDVYTWASTSGLSQTTQSSAGFTVSTYGTITGTYQTAFTETATQATSPTVGLSKTQADTRTANSKLNNPLASNSKTYTGTKTSTSLLNTWVTSITRAFTGARSPNSLLQNQGSVISRTFVGTRKSSSILSNVMASNSKVYAGTKTISSLLSNLLFSISRTTTLQRSISSLLPNLLGTITRGSTTSRTTTSILANMALSPSRNTATTRTTLSLLSTSLISLTKTLNGYRTPTSLIGNLLATTSQQQTLTRTSTSQISNIQDSPSRTTTLTRTSNSLLAAILASVTGNTSHHSVFSISEILSGIIDSSSAQRTGSWIVYVGETLGQLLAPVIGLKYVLASGTYTQTDLTAVGIIAGILVGCVCFSLFIAFKRRSSNETLDK